jgi:hypothetical protein
VPTLDDRAIRERLRRRSHLIRLRTSAVNRSFGLLTQWGLRRNLTALRRPGALDELEEHGVPGTWRHSIATLLGVVDDLDRQLAPLERELRPLARKDERAKLLMTIPGLAELLGLTIASEIGDVARFPSARKLVGYAGLAPKIKQSGESSRIGRISKAGPATLRWAAVEASQQASRPSNPLAPALRGDQAPPRQVEPRQGRRRPQGPDRLLAHPRPPRALQAQRFPHHRSCPGKLLHSSGRLRPTNDLRKPGQLQSEHVRERAPKENSAGRCRNRGGGRTQPRRPLTSRRPSKRRVAGPPPLPVGGIARPGPRGPGR